MTIHPTKAAASLLGVLLLIAVPAGPGRSQNILTNGSFELPILTPGPSVPKIFPGSNNLSGWSIDGLGSLYLVLEVADRLPALDGSQYVDFNGRPNGVSLSQSFATSVGEMYEVSFTLGRFQAPSTEYVTAKATDSTGSVLETIEVAAPMDVGWGSPSRFRFTATSPTSSVRFQSTNGTVNVDLCMDAVSVERVTPRLSIETSHVRICWESEFDQTYQLQYRSSMTTNVWTNLGAPIAGIGATDCTVQAVSDSQGFYRIIRLP